MHVTITVDNQNIKLFIFDLVTPHTTALTDFICIALSY